MAVHEPFMNHSGSHELVHEHFHGKSMNDNGQFTNEMVHELPFVIMNHSGSHELVHEHFHGKSMNDKLQFMNEMVLELPFVVHGLFMKTFMTST